MFLKKIVLIFLICFIAVSSFAVKEGNDNCEDAILKKVSLKTVMNPDGVTSEEWQSMFYNTKVFLERNIEYFNNMIYLFNSHFTKASTEQQKLYLKDYKNQFNEDLNLPFPSVDMVEIDSLEKIQHLIQSCSILANIKKFFLNDTTFPTQKCDALSKERYLPNLNISSQCRIFLNSFVPRLTPIQFMHANDLHKNNIKGRYANVIVLEDDLTSEHDFYKKNDKVKVFKSQIGSVQENHGAHVTGIVHQIAPKSNIFVAKTFDKDEFFLAVSAKIVNASYSDEFPGVHLLKSDALQKIKNILQLYNSKRGGYQNNFFCSDPFSQDLKQLMELNDLEKHLDDIRLTQYKYTRFAKSIVDYYKNYSVSVYDTPAENILQKVIANSISQVEGAVKKDILCFGEKLRIQAFGNSYNEEKFSCFALPYLCQSDKFLSQSILVVNINHTNVIHKTSNRPDFTLKKVIQKNIDARKKNDVETVDEVMMKIQNSTVSALGTDVWSTGANSGYEFCSGTSMAAPMVTGVAALIEGEFPSFSVGDIRECILNSADRNFVVGKGKDAVNVVDLPQYEINILNESNVNGHKYIAFDPGQYGRGIINAKAALEYAKKKHNNSSLSIEKTANNVYQE